MRLHSCLLALAVGVAGAYSTPVSSSIPAGQGSIVGNPRNSGGILEFLGIPYAAPPVGDLRWKPPQATPAISCTYDATAFGASCISAEMRGPSFGPENEDCLYANVWTGAINQDEKRPVMVWVYGGGFEFGTSSQPNYNGNNLAQEGVVLVSFNYRLGVLGFLASRELDSEGTNSGNFGLQDQLAALRWVKENIVKFGGDPENVTVFGQSAGAHAIGMLMTSPLSDGLFHKAILESGAYWDSEHGSLRSFQDARIQGQAFQQKLNAKSIAQLRSLPATMVNNAALWNSSTDPAITAFAPSIDNYVNTAVPAEGFDSQRTPKIPVLAGFTADEESVFMSRALPHRTARQYTVSAREFFADRTKEALRLYPGKNKSEATESARALDGDLIIREQTWEAIDRQSEQTDQAYGYYFTYTSPYSPKPVHTAEIDFVFGNLGPSHFFPNSSAPSAADAALSKKLMAYWTNFAKTGDPNAHDSSLPHWPAYQGGKFLELGDTISAIDTPNAARFSFIESLRRNGVLPLRWRHEFVNN